jgi:protein-S-isoprenylcysteine O-methyltransferase Ste14
MEVAERVVMISLQAKAWLGLAGLAASMGLLIFLTAGTLDYWQAWVFLTIYLGASVLMVLYLTKKDRELLARRMRSGPFAEKERAQKAIMLCATLGFIALLVIPALDRRMQWSHAPPLAAILGDALVLAGWLITFAVLRANSFASATIEIAIGQTVVSTGPYAIVRHPMYSGSLLLLLGTPLALGSYWGLVVVPATLVFLLWRTFDEERFLRKNLQGYSEYCAKTRWRLLPGVF